MSDLDPNLLAKLSEMERAELNHCDRTFSSIERMTLQKIQSLISDRKSAQTGFKAAVAELGKCRAELKQLREKLALPVCLICMTHHWPQGHVKHCPEDYDE